ncbi:MAG: hypothetical protein EBS84_17165 [Proteobacteria bacterium]|nr:hypothetical protein [Verrucomicrobiota bacterium]NBU10724.1 hypothetical protein [Pseudomonadota bacterium]
MLLLAIALATGVGCVGTERHPEADMAGTKRLLAMSQPTEQAAPHQLQRLQAAFLRDDGTLLLQIQGKPVNAAKTQPCTLEIPPPKPSSPTDALARRVEVPSSALHLGWDATLTNAHPLPIGPVMTLKAKEVYDWNRLTLTEGQTEEIRLVQRLDSVNQWELLLLRAQPKPTQNRFTIFEVRPTMVPVGHRALLVLMPFALAEDALTNVGAPVGTAGAVPAVGAALYFTGSLPVVAVVVTCQFLWKGTKAVGQAIGLVEKESTP